MQVEQKHTRRRRRKNPSKSATARQENLGEAPIIVFMFGIDLNIKLLFVVWGSSTTLLAEYTFVVVCLANFLCWSDAQFCEGKRQKPTIYSRCVYSYVSPNEKP